MALKKLFDDLVMVPGLVNAYVIDTKNGLVAIDTGFPGSVDKILAAIGEFGRAPQDLRAIVLTHCHVDHAGSAAALAKTTGAKVYAHALDAPIIQAGTGFRTVHAAPGLRNRIIFRLLSMRRPSIEPVPVDHLIHPDEPLPFDPDLTAIHIPGHSAGQVALLWKRHGGVLFAADACVHRRGMVVTMANEDLALARRSLAVLAGLTFDVACFGHGNPIMSRADEEFRRTWLSADVPDQVAHPATAVT